MNKYILTFLHLLFFMPIFSQVVVDQEGALIRSDTLKNDIYLCFTGHDQVDGFEHVISLLNMLKVKGSFFLTGDFVRNNEDLVKEIAYNGHFVGAHSDKHLLYCDWSNRDSLLFSENEIEEDILQNLSALKRLGITPKYFMPPYEWYNRKVVEIAAHLDQITVNFTPGTRSNADYTTPDMPNYLSSEDILESIYNYQSSNSMNGFHLLIHPGTSPKRMDKLYLFLDEIITKLKQEGYQFNSF